MKHGTLGAISMSGRAQASASSLIAAGTLFAVLIGGCGPRHGAVAPTPPSNVRQPGVPTSAAVGAPTVAASTAPAPTATGTAVPASASIFAPFVGDWSAHGGGVTIRPDGSVTAEWRTYRWCDDDPRPPCDRTEGNAIIGGGSATFQLQTVAGGVAQGVVTNTSDPSSLRISSTVTFTLLAGDMIDVEPWGHTFCGPRAAPMGCGA